MTFLLFAIGVLLIGATVRVLVHVAVLPRLKLSQHFRQIEGYGFEHATAAADVAPRLRLNAAIAALAARIGRFTIERAPMLEPLGRGELAAAAFYEVSPEAVHGYRAIAAVSLPGLILLYVASAGGFSLKSAGLVVVAAVIGWKLPAVVIKSKGRKRLADIDRVLPDLVDLLTATVEAGMGIAGSISLVANRFRGALGDELRLTLQQQQLGESNEQALNDMAERCDTPSVRAFVRTVNRGEAMGVSIGPILRELAGDVRRRRRQTAQTKMQKAPVKLLFPLMFLIMPALMLELSYPAVYTLIHNLSGRGL